LPAASDHGDPAFFDGNISPDNPAVRKKNFPIADDERIWFLFFNCLRITVCIT